MTHDVTLKAFGAHVQVTFRSHRECEKITILGLTWGRKVDILRALASSMLRRAETGMFDDKGQVEHSPKRKIQ